jgi:hypothetical protein
MRVSQFEIYRIAQRALEGSGAPYGVDRDGARAVAWLEARGLPGLARLDDDLPGLAGSFAGLRLGAANVIEAAGRSAIAFADAAVDLALAILTRGAGCLRLHGCRSPIFLLPAAIADPGPGMAVRWSLPRGDVVCRIDADGGVELECGEGVALDAALVDPGPAAVEIGPGFARAEATPRASGSRLDGVALSRRLDLSLAQGIEVDAGIWRRIDAVAGRVQVPASEASRLKGAGGGDANA